MISIECNPFYNFSTMQNLLEFGHQFKDKDYPKEILIQPSYDNTTKAWLDRINATQVKYKSSSIKMVDIVVYCPFTVSEPERIKKWKDKSVDCFVDYFGIRNIMAATYHSTTKPHIHFAIIPVVNNRLNWSYYTQRDTCRIPFFECIYLNDILI